MLPRSGCRGSRRSAARGWPRTPGGGCPHPAAEEDQRACKKDIVAIFYPFSQFCEIGISSLSLQKERKTDLSLFHGGVECAMYYCIETNPPWAGGAEADPGKGSPTRAQFQLPEFLVTNQPDEFY